MIKGVIFDLDGTLLNTVNDIHSVLNESLIKFGLPAVTLNQTRNYLGNGARILVKRAVGNSDEYFEKVYAYYSKKFPECGNGLTKLYDDEEYALNRLKSAGLKLAIVTNKPQNATKAVYDTFLSKFRFSEVLGQTEYYPLKPDSASTLAIIKRLGLKSEECVFVGDGETDVATADNAGIRCISVLWGYRTRKQLAAVGAKEFAENFRELADLILK